jgi:hypothetical protein
MGQVIKPAMEQTAKEHDEEKRCNDAFGAEWNKQ